MKKLLLPVLFFIMALSSISQVFVSIHGTITNTENGNPIPNHAVSIAIDSTAGWYYFNIVYTNNNGFYVDTVQVPSGSQGLLFIRTTDCRNDLHEQILNYNPGNLNFTSDFQICNTNSPCQAAFVAYPDSNAVYSYHFIDQSVGNITNWNWNFGDGQFSILQNPSHVYSQPGMYMVCLNIQSADSTCFSYTCDTIVVGNTPPCNAEFSYFHFQTDPMTIHFTNASVGGNGVNLWYFGDGASSTEENPIHTYQQTGQYFVGLSIGDSASGCFDYTYELIQVGDSVAEPCQAAFTAFPDSNALYSYHFIDQSTGNIISRLWDFGDGATSTEQNPMHTYQANGTYNVCLTIHGADSICSDIFCDSVYVGTGSGCQANFSYTISPPPGNRTVVFTDLSLSLPTSWLWNFGDGTSDTVQNPAHTYSNPGTYNVCLQITEGNCTSIFCQDVVLYDSSYFHVIYGQVFAGNFPVTAGLAMIFSSDSARNSKSYVAVCPTDSNGVYYFTMVPDGNYYILAVPSDSMGYLPTYYGDVINWEQATVISLGAENNPYNINLVASGNMTPGPGSASGLINMEGLKETIVDKVNMILMDAKGNAIGFTRVSTTGTFNFPTMAYGTYLLHPEMPGITSDQVMITLTPENPHAEVIMTYNGNSILGMNRETSIVNSWNVYPNPVIDQLNLSIDLKQSVKAEIGLYNFNGQLVSARHVVLQDGNNKIPVSTASFPVGLYTLRIYSSAGVNIVTKVVKTR